MHHSFGLDGPDFESFLKQDGVLALSFEVHPRLFDCWNSSSSVPMVHLAPSELPLLFFLHFGSEAASLDWGEEKDEDFLLAAVAAKPSLSC